MHPAVVDRARAALSHAIRSFDLDFMSDAALVPTMNDLDIVLTSDDVFT